MGDSNFDSLKLDKTAKISSPNAAAAAGVAPDATEFLAVVTLLNEIKTKLNAIFQA